MKILPAVAFLAALAASLPAQAGCPNRTEPNAVMDSPVPEAARPGVERLSGTAARSGPNIVGDAIAGIEKPRGNGAPRATRPTGETVPCVKCVAI